VLFGTVGSAAAQDGGGFVGGLGGVTFNTVTSGIFAGRGGVHIGRGLFVIGEVGRAQNVLPKAIEEDLDDAEAFIEDVTGLPVSLELELPATYGFGGVRWVAPGGRRIRPFLEAGVGVAHLAAKIHATVAGVPVPQDVIDQFDDLDLDTNEVLLAVGGGVNLGLSRIVSIDAGYRYMRVFLEEAEVSVNSAVNTSVLYVGVSIGFGR
jgi:hypothetical protein